MNQPTLPLSSYYFRETGDRHVLPKKKNSRLFAQPNNILLIDRRCRRPDLLSTSVVVVVTFIIQQ